MTTAMEIADYLVPGVLRLAAALCEEAPVKPLLEVRGLMFM